MQLNRVAIAQSYRGSPAAAAALKAVYVHETAAACAAMDRIMSMHPMVYLTRG